VTTEDASSISHFSLLLVGCGVRIQNYAWESTLPILVAARSKAWFYVLSLVGNAGSTLAGDIDLRLL
jgi:hypothetical protein